MKTPEEFVRDYLAQYLCDYDAKTMVDAIASRDRDIIEQAAALVDKDAQANWDIAEKQADVDDEEAEIHEGVAMALDGLATDIRALFPAGTAPLNPAQAYVPPHVREQLASPAGTAVPEVCRACNTCDGQGGWFYKTKQSMVPCGDCNGTGRR